MKKLVFPLLFLFCFVVEAQLPPKEAYDYNIKQIHSGHSLTDPLFHPWPGQYRFLLTVELNTNWDNLGKSTIPGSPLHWRWNNGGDVTPDARSDIADWELLCITEGVPLFIESPDMQSWEREGLESQREYLSLFVNNAWNNGDNGNGAATLLWTTWTNIDDSDGPWRPLLDAYEEEWENMQDYANENRPEGAPPVYLIPGHRMMARLYDDIQLDLVPGIDSLPQFFEDNIHLNHLGAYAMAMIHYACLYNESPVGLPANLHYDLDNETHPSNELALYLQTMIWEVVTGYSERTGVYEVITDIDLEEPSTKNLLAYPNPTESILNLTHTDEVMTFTISDAAGRILIQTNSREIDISDLNKGIYYVRAGEQVIKIEKL